MLTDLFSTGLLKTNRDIDYKNVYLTTYKQNIKGRVKVVHFIDDCRVWTIIFNKGFFYKIKIFSNLVIHKFTIVKF